MAQTQSMIRDQQSLRRHYEVERELADRLRSASAAERLRLYRSVYNELFLRVPDHPQLTRKQVGGEEQRQASERQLRLLRRFLRPDSVYLEIGAGDCDLTCRVAAQVRQVYAVEVSDEIAGAKQRPANFSLIITDGIRIDVPPGSIDLAYSHQLLEHLHPDDAAAQLGEILRALRPGGLYICTTPHRFSGPHDISKYFETVARGFHLKEYNYRELRRLFLEAGFVKTSAWIGVKGRHFRLPNSLTFLLEGAVGACPMRCRRRLVRLPLLRSLFDSVTIVGQKATRARG